MDPGAEDGTGAGASTRVLVVEDDEDMLLAIRDGLQSLGFAVTVAGNGVDGYSLASEGDFDVVVSDIRLPGLSGTELSRRVVRKPHPPRVVLITAFPGRETLLEAKESGAARLLAKPLSLRDLAQVVHLAAMERKSGLPTVAAK